MRVLLLLLVALIGAVALAGYAYEDQGYVLIVRGPWQIETSLTFFIIAALVAFGLLYGLIRSTVNLLRLPDKLRERRHRRRAVKAQLLSRRGLIELAEGRWEKAERNLIRGAEHSEMPLLNYLGAARAAQKLGASDRRDHYLSLAHSCVPDAELAVGLTQAEVQLSQGQLEQARATLTYLKGLAPHHGHLLYLLCRLYEALGSWSELAELLPEVGKQRLVGEEEFAALERNAYRHLLNEAGDDIGKLRETWGGLPRNARQDPILLGCHVRRLSRAGQGAEAEELLRDAIKREWDGELVRLYGLVQGADIKRQLAEAEGWAKRHERDPLLLLTLGRLCLKNRLWGKARAYLEASLGIDPRPEGYRELGVLLDQFKEPERARECFRKGLELSVDSDSCSEIQMDDPLTAPRRLG